MIWLQKPMTPFLSLFTTGQRQTLWGLNVNFLPSALSSGPSSEKWGADFLLSLGTSLSGLASEMGSLFPLMTSQRQNIKIPHLGHCNGHRGKRL